MSLALIVGLALLTLGVPVLCYLFPEWTGGILAPAHTRGVRALIRAEEGGARDSGFSLRSRAREELFKSVKESESKAHRVTDAQLTLRKRLKYAQWEIPPVIFHGLEFGIGATVFLLSSIHMGFAIQIVSLLSGPLFMRWLLNFVMDRRFKRFDADYPQFLMSVVALLKTGMTPIGALESAAKGLENGSLVKEEVELMIERLRLGVPEDRSIGGFGEDIYHPEIELFVQALLLSRRVGGNLSDTLERLARQVRKRQYFRNSANAAIGMQRGSIWIILVLLFGIQFYIYLTNPSMVVEAWNDEVGWQVWQAALVIVMLGMFWIRQVTKIKI